MNSRTRKQRLFQYYGKVTNKIEKTNLQPQIKSNPFDLLFKNLQPLAEVLESDEVPVVKKQRGRPRKYFSEETPPNFHKHKIEEDVTPSFKEIGNDLKMKMVSDFRRHYHLTQIPLRRSLERISQQYKITYEQAYHLLEKEI